MHGTRILLVILLCRSGESNNHRQKFKLGINVLVVKSSVKHTAFTESREYIVKTSMGIDSARWLVFVT